jgi:hypothetical protein
MKNKYKFISVVFCSLMLTVWGCGLDNYKAPNAGIKGKVIDNITNKPLQTVQPHGFQIRLMEISQTYEDPTPIDFWGKADGTFRNSKLFADKYKVIPINGAFVEPDTQTVNIRGMKTVSFKVTPFIELTNVSVTPIPKGAIVKYQITKTQDSSKILISESLASPYPTVGHTVFGQKISHDLSGISDKTIENKQFADTLRGLKPDSTGGKVNKTYYIRAAAKTNNANNRYNYSKVFKISVEQ